jgi:hypothetical protein
MKTTITQQLIRLGTLSKQLPWVEKYQTIKYSSQDVNIRLCQNELCPQEKHAIMHDCNPRQ